MALWDDIDVLLTPGTATTAIAAEGGYGKPAPLAIDVAGRFTPFTPLFNFTGQPAITVPAGIGADGVPLSVQLVGPPRRRGPALLARRTARVGRAMGAAAPAVGVRSLRR